MPIRRVDKGRNHSYLINDIPAMGVTTALSLGMPKPALMYWSARTVAEAVYDMSSRDLQELRGKRRDTAVHTLKSIPFRARDKAAVQGTDVHAIAEQLIHGNDVQVPQPLTGYVESAVRFMDEWKVAPLVVEKTVGSYAWSYCGTLDLVAELPDQRRVLFDYKTSAKGIYPETALQLAAYRYADVYVDGDVEIPMSDVGIDECKAVWLRADGYDVIPVKADEQVFKQFLHVLTVARFTDSLPGLVGAAEFPQ